jgi:hypothetical protein
MLLSAKSYNFADNNMLYLLAGVQNYGKSDFRLSCNIHHQGAMLLATFLRQLRGLIR